MDLLIEKGDSRTYLSGYKVITTSFEESSPSVKRNNTQIQYRNGNVDFGGWNEVKTIDYVGYYRADDLEDEEYLRERIYALLSDPEGYYVTQLKNDNDDSFERPGETSGNYFDKQVNRPSHKRFYVYASSLESELVGSYGGHVLYKISAKFTTMKLPYGESVPRDLDVKPNMPYYGMNFAIASHASASNTKSADAYPINMQLSEDLSGKTITTSVKVIVTNYKGKVDSTNSRGPYIDIKDGLSTGHWSGLIDYLHITGNGVYTSSPKTMTKHPLTGTANNINVEMYNLNATIEIWIKLEKGSMATPWTPAPEDTEYSAWYTKIYYSTDNLVIPYAGTVTCNQLEQGFTVEFTAKENGSNLTISLNGTDFIAPGNVVSGDVFKLSGYEYLLNGISIVKSTNKAYFKLLPGIANKISSSIAGEIKILNFQNLYA